METALRFSGYLGVVLVVFGVLGAIVAPPVTDQPLLVAHLVLGVLCLVAWGVTSGLEGFSKAGAALSGRTARFGVNAFLYSVVALGLVVVVNVFSFMNDKRWDLTEAGVYSLSEKSVKITQSLKQKLRLLAVDAPQVQERGKTEDLLKLYRYHNDVMVSYEILDPRARPLEMDKLEMKAGNLLYLEYGEGAQKAVSRINAIDEQSVTNAIIKLTRGAAKKIYHIQGHGEPQLENQAQGGLKDFESALSDEHLQIEGLLLAQTGKIPEDAAAVIFAAPRKPLPQAEKDIITKYGDAGGRLVLMGDAEIRDVSDVGEIAEHFGITIGKDVIIDEQLRLFAGPEMAVQFVPQQFSQHPVTARLTRAEPPVFSFASSVSAGKTDTKSTYTELMKSGPNSWAEKNLDLIYNSTEPSAAKEADDIAGPVVIAAALERKLDTPQDSPAVPSDEVKFEKSIRVAAFGDSTWIQNGNLAAMGNRDLALNVINWTVGESDAVAIGPKSLRASAIPIRQETFNVILALSFMGPELILVLGLFIWWNRRRTALA
jgi:ABC-type uncharacterized transport system involved in gliding motility auxiliary subunit